MEEKTFHKKILFARIWISI